MLIPGEPLWRPRRPLRIVGHRIDDPVTIVARKLLKVSLWAATAWVVWQWVTIGP